MPNISALKAYAKNKNIALLLKKIPLEHVAHSKLPHMIKVHVTYLGPTGSQMGKTAKDTARVLGGMYDGIEYRGFLNVL